MFSDCRLDLSSSRDGAPAHGRIAIVATDTMKMVRGLAASGLLALLPAAPAAAQDVQYYELDKGDRPHDVAPAADGTVWYAGQRAGVAGRLDPNTGKLTRIPLGPGSAPHGVIVGPDGHAWFTDSGQNAIVRVDARSHEVTVWKLPEGSGYANLNTAAFDRDGRIWFTGQGGIHGRLDPATGDMKVWDAPRGRGPYGISATADGDIWFVSLAGGYLAKVDLETGEPHIVEPREPGVGPRRVWPDSNGRLWVSEWNAGHVSVYDPKAGSWRAWPLPAAGAKCYSVYVDERDKVWLSDFTSNAILMFDPQTETFQSFPSDRPRAQVRQMLGRDGEAWGAESGTDRLVVIRYGKAMD
jgi:virginiamycin B lyase